MFDIDMESDLQHLIRISIDKMVNVESAHNSPRRGNRKGGEIDLRKTLLVAHLIQEVRTAYLQDDCQIFENSISDSHSHSDNNEEEQCCRDENNQCIEYNKSWKRQQFTHESNYFIEDDSTVVSHASNVQSCLTNSKSMVSRICQVTRPLCVSVNTNHVMTYTTKDDEEKTSNQDSCCSQEEDEILCEELDVSSCCEVESTPLVVGCDVETTSQEITKSPLSTSISLSSALLPPSSTVETTRHDETTPCNKVPLNNDKFHNNDHLSQDAEETTTTRNNTKTLTTAVRKPSSNNVSTLPKKKRPLPKEFLEELEQQPSSKHSKTSENNNSYQNTIVSVSTPATTSVTSQSWSTSTTVSTVCSTIGITTHNRKHDAMNPKVVVQLTQSLDYSFPLTCTQILLHHTSSQVYDKLSRRALA